MWIIFTLIIILCLIIFGVWALFSKTYHMDVIMSDNSQETIFYMTISKTDPISSSNNVHCTIDGNIINKDMIQKYKRDSIRVVDESLMNKIINKWESIL